VRSTAGDFWLGVGVAVRTFTIAFVRHARIELANGGFIALCSSIERMGRVNGYFTAWIELQSATLKVEKRAELRYAEERERFSTTRSKEHS